MSDVLTPPSGGSALPVPVGRDSGVFDILRTTRSIRRLRPDPVPGDLIRQVIEAATWAPSAENQQATEYVVVTDAGQKARLAPLWRRAISLYSIVTSDPDAGMSPASAETVHALAANLENVPVIIAICHPIMPAFERPDPDVLKGLYRELGLRRQLRLMRSLPTIVTLHDAGSAFPASQNLLLAARALGLGASVFQLHMFVEDEVKAVLGVPDGVRVVQLVTMGWPEGHFGPVRRRPVDDVMHADRW